MANELTFKIIDIEDSILEFKHGLLSEQQLLDQIQSILHGEEIRREVW